MQIKTFMSQHLCPYVAGASSGADGNYEKSRVANTNDRYDY